MLKPLKASVQLANSTQITRRVTAGVLPPTGRAQMTDSYPEQTPCTELLDQEVSKKRRDDRQQDC